MDQSDHAKSVIAITVPKVVQKVITNIHFLNLADFHCSFLHSHHGWEGIGFMWKMTFEIFIKSLRFETPWVRKKGFYESVCLSVCLSVRLSELSFGTLYRSRKCNDKFVNLPHPIKIEGLSTTFVFLKIIFLNNKKFQYMF